MLREPIVDAAGEESGEKNKTFGRGDETERLIDVRRCDGRQVCAGDPDEHQPAEGVELDTTAAGLLHVCLILHEGRGFLVVALFARAA